MHKNAIVPGSLSAVAKRDGQSLAETFLNADAVIIVDTSGSMATDDSRGGRRRYDVALEELAALQQHMPGKIGVLAFSSTVQFCPGGQPPLLGGGTDLAGALRFAKVADVEGMRFVVISDGAPDDPDQAIAVARTFKVPISTIYVGPEACPTGRDFLWQLAKASGGENVMADRVQELANKTQQLLLSTIGH